MSGAGAAAAAAPASGATEGPTARTAMPAGTAGFAATATFRTAPSGALVALTIDDGPTREWTPQVLAILRRHNARATFFRIGQRAQAAADLVVQTAAEGHEQGNHTWAHDDLTHHDEGFDLATLRRTHEVLTRLTGQAPTACRPPYGRIDSVGLAACASLRYEIVLWSEHVTGSNATGDVDAILRQPSAGSIILAHDGGSEPNANLMRQLDRLLTVMTGRGYQFITVSDLLGRRIQ